MASGHDPVNEISLAVLLMEPSLVHLAPLFGPFISKNPLSALQIHSYDIWAQWMNNFLSFLRLIGTSCPMVVTLFYLLKVAW